MKFEEAIALLRQGKKIYRSSDREKGYLKGTINKPCGSFYLTLWDVVAEDWVGED